VATVLNLNTPYPQVYNILVPKIWLESVLLPKSVHLFGRFYYPPHRNQIFSNHTIWGHYIRSKQCETINTLKLWATVMWCLIRNY